MTPFIWKKNKNVLMVIEIRKLGWGEGDTGHFVCDGNILNLVLGGGYKDICKSKLMKLKA